MCEELPQWLETKCQFIVYEKLVQDYSWVKLETLPLPIHSQQSKYNVGILTLTFISMQILSSKFLFAYGEHLNKSLSSRTLKDAHKLFLITSGLLPPSAAGAFHQPGRHLGQGTSLELKPYSWPITASPLFLWMLKLGKFSIAKVHALKSSGS